MVNQAEYAALLDELKKINTRLDKSEEITATLHQELHNRDLTPHTRNHTVEEIKLANLPTFEGDGDPETYLDWERRLDRLFRYKNLDDTKRFHYAFLKLTKYASLWFESFQNQRERDGKAQLTTWTELKQKKKKKFVPRLHKQDLFSMLNSLQQGYITIDNYIKEFEKLYIACDCKDEEEQKIAKFVLGLNASMRSKLEKLNKGKSSVFGQFSAPKAEHTAAHETEQQAAPKDDTVVALKANLKKLHSRSNQRGRQYVFVAKKEMRKRRRKAGGKSRRCENGRENEKDMDEQEMRNGRENEMERDEQEMRKWEGKRDGEGCEYASCFNGGFEGGRRKEEKRALEEGK
uniref:Retrotransposon gag domain-containing protein n=1 Tax=Chenopodium quinoa TaxID=63459 RepID=A0A803MLT1_CHEQI